MKRFLVSEYYLSGACRLGNEELVMVIVGGLGVGEVCVCVFVCVSVRTDRYIYIYI